MTATDRNRCRWWTDGPSGRCPGPQQFPGMSNVPPFCGEHLRQLEPWVTARAARQGSTAEGWITWAARRAAAADATLRALGEVPPLPRPASRHGANMRPA